MHTVRPDKSAVALVSAHFLPSNLASVHRTRVMAAGLRSCGWEPTIITVSSRYYEEPAEEKSLAFLPEGIEILEAAALPNRLCRKFGLGDVSIRGQFGMRHCLRQAYARGRAQLVFTTVLPGYTSLVGAWAKRKLGIPVVLDYQDPWMAISNVKTPIFTKAALAKMLARLLEPYAVRAADAITAVSYRTLDTLRVRKLLRPEVLTAIVPIGADARDIEIARSTGSSCVSPEPSTFTMTYCGTIIAGMLPTIRTLFAAIAELRRKQPAWKLRICLLGTSAQPNGKDRLGIESLAGQLGIGDSLCLQPGRVPYVDAIATMLNSDLLLLLGSGDPHYTASKLFPCWLTGKPILGIFHNESSVCDLARELGGAHIVTYGPEGPEQHSPAVLKAISDIGEGPDHGLPPRNTRAFNPYSSEGVASRFAKVFTAVTQPRHVR
jgi:glycosyltransferase involved in cell wall biosynthesis